MCREIFCTDFLLCNVQLLLRGVEGRNMSEEDGLIGLGELRNFLRRRNCNSGSSSSSLSVFYVLLWSFFLLISICFAVKQAHQREQWSLVWVGLTSLELSFLEQCQSTVLSQYYFQSVLLIFFSLMAVLLFSFEEMLLLLQVDLLNLSWTYFLYFRCDLMLFFLNR